MSEIVLQQSVHDLQTRLAVIESKMLPLFDNGQPGIITRLNTKIEETNRNINRLTLIAVVSAALSSGGIPLAHILGWLK